MQTRGNNVVHRSRRWCLAGLVEVLEQIRIADRSFFGAQLEFGRYDVQFWDEDNPYACFDCDSYYIEGFDA